MRALLLVLLFTIFGPRACGQGTTPAPGQPMLPPPPPPPPNPPPRFSQDDTQTTAAPTQFTTLTPLATLTPPKITTPPVPTHDPIQELIDEGGTEIILDTEFKSFDAKEESEFQIVMRDACNRYCQTKGNCEGSYKTVSKHDVIVYNKRSVKVGTAISRAVTSRTAVSFYIKNPKAQTMLTMTTEQLEAMFVAERKNIEGDLGYRLDMGDLDGFKPFTNGLLLDSWLIALLCVIGLFILVTLFVTAIYFRNKKRDNKLTFEDLEMEPHYENPEKVLPPGPGVGAGFPKKVKVDATTNVYQSEILSETKSVFIKPSMVKARADTDTQIYAVVHKEKANNEEEEATRKEEEQRQESEEPQVSPNAIVVTADVSSSNDGNSQSSEEPGSPSPDDHVAPPDYEQATREETDVIESPGDEGASTSAVPAASTVDEDEDLPPPPPPSGDPDYASSISDDLPPPPPPTEEAKDSTASEASSRKDSISSPSRKDSSASSAQSSAKGSSSAGKEAAEVVGALENLIADQSKEVSEDQQGLDNEGFETTVGEDGQPTTEL